MTNLVCLLTRVMKVRYFPSSDFLSAPLGSNPSFGWCKGIVAYGD